MEFFDSEGVKSLFDKDEAVHALLCCIAERGNVEETTVEEFNRILMEKGISRDHREQIKLLQELEKLGCGDYRNGRGTKRTRIIWSHVQHIISVVNEALEKEETGNQGSTRKHHILRDVRGQMLPHRYTLRPDLSVEFTLPKDLTQIEASRLARYIETLPFSQGIVA